MIRVGTMALAATLLVLSAAQAQSPPPENDDARFTFHRADDGGYLRLDGRSGAVSSCTRKPAGWLCQAVPDERATLEAEIGRLQGENAALKKSLLARGLPLPGTVRPEAPGARQDDSRIQLPSDADLNRMMTFLEKVWRRMVEMVSNAQKELQKQ
jgi:hypothetical protein